jgi:hypothetical protein
MRRLLCLLFCLFFVLPLTAQEATPDPANTIVYGQVVTGQISDATPSRVYTFEALRCDFVSIRLQATSGNLDPMLTVLDAGGAAVLTRDDTEGTAGVFYEPLSIPGSGSYTLVIGRFGYGLGTTSGGYELVIDRIGNGSDYGCVLRYGDTVTNTIDAEQTEVWYRFEGEQGQIVRITMRAIGGTLDPRLFVTDAGGYILQQADDTGTDLDAQVESLLIPADGIYYIIATRYGVGGGSFVMTLDETANSGLGNSALAAIPLRVGATIEGELSDDLPAQFYRFEARQNDVVSIRMGRLSNDLDTFIVITDAALNELIFDDDGGDGQNSRIDDYLIPADGTYYLIATRFEREVGLTSGRYELTLQDDGNAFDDLPPGVRRLIVPSTVTGTIDAVTPDVLYAFWGNAGDLVSVSMNRTTGDLDPLVSVLNSGQATLISDDDSGGTQNALIDDYTLPGTGVYLVRASSLGEAQTSGDYSLTVFLQQAETEDNPTN